MDPVILPPAPRARVLARTQQFIAAARTSAAAADGGGDDADEPVIQALDPGYIQLFSYFSEPTEYPPSPEITPPSGG